MSRGVAGAFPGNLLRRSEPQPDGCIYFTGYVNPNTGYGSLWNGRRTVNAHRSAYEHFVGAIPDGHDLDHECHNDSTCTGGPTCLHRRCVNVEHLAVKTRRENILASSRTSASVNLNKTQCKNGHEFSPTNTYVNPTTGHRTCIACQSRFKREYRMRQKAHQ